MKVPFWLIRSTLLPKDAEHRDPNHANEIMNQKRNHLVNRHDVLNVLVPLADIRHLDFAYLRILYLKKINSVTHLRARCNKLAKKACKNARFLHSTLNHDRNKVIKPKYYS